MNFDDMVKTARAIADESIATPPLMIRVRTAEGQESHISVVGMTANRAKDYAAKLAAKQGWSVLAEPETHPTLK